MKDDLVEKRVSIKCGDVGTGNEPIMPPLPLSEIESGECGDEVLTDGKGTSPERWQKFKQSTPLNFSMIVRPTRAMLLIAFACVSVFFLAKGLEILTVNAYIAQGMSLSGSSSSRARAVESFMVACELALQKGGELYRVSVVQDEYKQLFDRYTRSQNKEASAATMIALSKRITAAYPSDVYKDYYVSDMLYDTAKRAFSDGSYELAGELTFFSDCFRIESPGESGAVDLDRYDRKMIIARGLLAAGKMPAAIAETRTCINDLSRADPADCVRNYWMSFAAKGPPSVELVKALRNAGQTALSDELLKTVARAESAIRSDGFATLEYAQRLLEDGKVLDAIPLLEKVTYDPSSDATVVSTAKDLLDKLTGPVESQDAEP